MDLASQQLLNQVPNAIGTQILKEAIDAGESISIDGSIVGRDANAISLSVGAATVYRIQIADVVKLATLSNEESPNGVIASGVLARVIVKNKAEIVMERLLRVGVELVTPQSGTTARCPDQCTQPVQCGAGCCCGGKKCRGRSCVD